MFDRARVAYQQQNQILFRPLPTDGYPDWEYQYCEERVYVFRKKGSSVLYLSDGGNPVKALNKILEGEKNDTEV